MFAQAASESITGVGFGITLNPEYLTDVDIVDLIQSIEAEIPIILYRYVAPWLMQEEQEALNTGGASIGETWTPNSPEYDRHKLATGHGDQQLVYEGHLAAALGEWQYAPDTQSIVVGLSGEAIPYGGEQEKRGRVFIGITEDQKETLADMIASWLENNLHVSPGAIQVSEV